MSVSADVYKLDPGAVIELFELDVTSLGGTVHYFHAGTNGLQTSVIWQGKTYQPWPVEAKGFSKNTHGQLPRPTLSMSNLDGTIGALASQYGDLLNAKVTRHITFAKYLDAANFPDGNPTADSTSHLPDDVFYVDQKTAENRRIIEFALAAKMDVQGVMIPLRVVTPSCSWAYRGTECGYSGGPVADEYDVATTDSTKDKCSKRLTGCKLRFGSTAALPFGGFPGTAQIK